MDIIFRDGGSKNKIGKIKIPGLLSAAQKPTKILAGLVVRVGKNFVLIQYFARVKNFGSITYSGVKGLLKKERIF